MSPAGLAPAIAAPGLPGRRVTGTFQVPEDSTGGHASTVAR